MTPFLYLIIAGFLVFMITLGFTSVWSSLPHHSVRAKAPGKRTPHQAAHGRVDHGLG
jgi:hypothetical protein